MAPSKASKAQRAKAVADAVATMRKGRTTSSKVARDEVNDDHLVSIAQGTSPIVAGMTTDLAATLAGIEQRAAKLVSTLSPPKVWGDQPTNDAFASKAHEAKVPGAGRVVGARADEATMLAHIESWVGRYGPKAPSKASREFQRLNPGKGCWPVYRRLWGEYVADPTETLKGLAMTSKAATYADASFVTSFAEYVAQAAADEQHEHHALAVQVAAGKAQPEPTPEPEPQPEPEPKAPAKRKAPAAKAPKAPARKRTSRKAAGQ